MRFGAELCKPAGDKECHQLDGGDSGDSVRRVAVPERVTLQALREANGKTVAAIAEAFGAEEEEVRRFERRLFSVVSRYAEAMRGLRCEIAFIYEDGTRILITGDPEEWRT